VKTRARDQSSGSVQIINDTTFCAKQLIRQWAYFVTDRYKGIVQQLRKSLLKSIWLRQRLNCLLKSIPIDIFADV
jgi:hypothetical protein